MTKQLKSLRRYEDYYDGRIIIQCEMHNKRKVQEATESQLEAFLLLGGRYDYSIIEWNYCVTKAEANAAIELLKEGLKIIIDIIPDSTY